MTRAEIDAKFREIYLAGGSPNTLTFTVTPAKIEVVKRVLEGELIVLTPEERARLNGWLDDVLTEVK